MPARMARRMALYQSVRRVRTDSGRSQRPRGSGRSGLVAENVAGSPDGVDQPALPRPVDLAAEVADVDVDHARLGVEAESPDVLGQHGARLDAPGVTHEVLEQRVLPHGELDLPVPAGHLASGRIEGQVDDLQER